MPNLASIAAVVVTHNPEIGLLHENLRQITDQVAYVLVFDNGSENASDVTHAVELIGNGEYLTAGSNIGVAAALNRLADAARSRGCPWIVTLDQDSVAPPGMVAELAAHADSSTPLATPYILDRNKADLGDFLSLQLPPVQYFSRAASKGAITSGSLLSTDALRDVGWFDERFFIDYVDYDLNARLLQAGYRIARVNSTYLSHQVGDAKPTWLVVPRRGIDGRWALERFYSFGHSPTRCYYKARNRVLYSKRHWRWVGLANEGVAQIPQQILLTLVFEGDRLAKLKAFAAGVRDGVRMPASKPSSERRDS